MKEDKEVSGGLSLKMWLRLIPYSKIPYNDTLLQIMKGGDDDE